MYNDWPSKAEAAQRIGISERTLERMIARGEIQQAYRNIPGRRPLAVLNPQDVDRIAERTLQAQPFVLPATIEATKEVATIPTAARDVAEILAAALAGIKVTDKLFLTLEEAANLSGLSKGTLRALIRDGKLPAARIRGYLIRAEDLRALRLV